MIHNKAHMKLGHRKVIEQMFNQNYLLRNIARKLQIKKVDPIIINLTPTLLHRK